MQPRSPWVVHLRVAQKKTGTAGREKQLITVHTGRFVTPARRGLQRCAAWPHPPGIQMPALGAGGWVVMFFVVDIVIACGTIRHRQQAAAGPEAVLIFTSSSIPRDAPGMEFVIALTVTLQTI